MPTSSPSGSHPSPALPHLFPASALIRLMHCSWCFRRCTPCVCVLCRHESVTFKATGRTYADAAQVGYSFHFQDIVTELFNSWGQEDVPTHPHSPTNTSIIYYLIYICARVCMCVYYHSNQSKFEAEKANFSPIIQFMFCRAGYGILPTKIKVKRQLKIDFPVNLHLPI